LDQDGFKLIVLLRLTPIFPFGLCNYILSASPVKLGWICLASLLGNIPNTIIHVTVGSLVGTSGGDTPPRLKHLTVLLTICFAVASSVFITLVGKRALRSVVDLEAGFQEQVPVEEDVSSDVSLSLDHRDLETGGEGEQLLVDTVDAVPINAITAEQQFTPQEMLILKGTFSAVFLVLLIGIPLILCFE